MNTSNCCDALIIQTDICSNCKEHCEAVDNTEEEIEGDDDSLDVKEGDWSAIYNREQLL